MAANPYENHSSSPLKLTEQSPEKQSFLNLTLQEAKKL